MGRTQLTHLAASRARLAAAILALALGALAAVTMPWTGTPAAFAHGELERSNPARNEVVAEMPPTIELVFSQELARSGGLPEAIVVNASGDQVDLGATLSDDDRTLITIEMPPAMPDGRYTVIWHTLSDEDGEEARGAFDFYVGAEPTEVPESPRPGETTAPAEPTATVAPTQPPDTQEPGDSDDGGSDGIPLWGLVAGIAAGAAAGFAGGMAAGGRKRQDPE